MTRVAPVILEGPDGSGKTTLAQKINREYVHLGPPDGVPPMIQYLEFVHEYQDQRVVYDRLHLGERVYGTVLRGHDRLGVVGQRMVERVLLGFGATCLLCLPPWEVVRDTWASRIDEELIKEEAVLEQVYMAYQTISTALPTARYDYTEAESYAKAVYAISQTVNKNEGPGIGNFKKGSILLVGEQVNQNKTIHGWPFVAESGSSAWLTLELEKAGVSEADLYWVNAKDQDGQFIFPGFIDKLQPRAILALGGEAKKWCRKNKVDAVAVPHPAFWKRFHAAEPYVEFHDALAPHVRR